MSHEITLIAQFQIHEGKQQEMKDSYDEAMAMVEQSDPDIISFTLFVNDDEAVFTSYEVYKNSEAILTNFEMAQDRIGRVLAASDLINSEIYGDASEEVRDLLSPYGTKFFNYDRGYKR